MAKISLVIHAGAGDIRRDKLSKELEEKMHAGLRDATHQAHQCLLNGGTAMDAVESAVRAMEDSSLFNAGRGSVVNADGQFEMDASIMDGSSQNAGAVTAVKRIKNPISAARKVIENSPAVLLFGTAAEEFAREHDCELVDGSYFFTARRWQDWIKQSKHGGAALDHSAPDGHGTVGAVAMDLEGKLAAATSTGGMTNKVSGRIGDSALIGAGTWARNAECAVSCTGTGEAYIRASAAHDLAARMRYAGESLDAAANQVIKTVGALGGEGGLIAIDGQGNISMPFNTAGMYRGYIDENNHIRTAIFEESE